MLPVDREVKRDIPVKGIEAKFEVAANFSALETRQAVRGVARSGPGGIPDP
jgi:hypothetical protein